MKSYGINRISKDLVEFALVYDNLEFSELNDQVLDVINYNSIEIEDEDYFNNEFYCSIMANMVLDDIDEINRKEMNIVLVKSLLGKAKIIEINDDEVMIIVRIANALEDLKIKIPAYKDIMKEKFIPDKEALNAIINYVLVNNGFVKKSDVAVYNHNCLVEIDVYGKNVLVDDSFSLIKDKYELLGSLEGKKVGDEVAVKNVLMNNRLEKHKIARIYEIKEKELSDDIVLKLNYHNTKNVEEFKKTFENDFNKASRFSFRLTLIYDELIQKSNNFNITKYLYDFASEVISFDTIGKFSKEKKYDLIKSRIIEAFLEEKYYNIDVAKKYDITYLHPLFKSEYDMLKLLKNIFDTDFETYLESRRDDALLYTLIKKGGFNHD